MSADNKFESEVIGNDSGKNEQYFSVTVSDKLKAENKSNIKGPLQSLTLLNNATNSLPIKSIDLPAEQQVPDIEKSILVMDVFNEKDFNQSKVPFDSHNYLDVICTNCYECIKEDEVDDHSLVCSIRFEEFRENDMSEDYNSRLFKLLESLKNKQKEVESLGLEEMKKFYAELSEATYEIILNNSSSKELVASFNKVSNRFKSAKEKSFFTDNYRIYFSLFIQRIGQLVLQKKKEM